MSAAARSRPRVVIVGGGFGGIEAARSLMREDVDLTLVDRQNYHLFQPLLYQVATAILQPADVAVPIRRVLSGRRRPTVLMDTVTGIDASARHVVTRERRIPYDHLILAPGARTSYFGNDAWRQSTFGLKTLYDATKLRHQILLAFERAELAGDAGERRRLMTFVVVGGGPNGVGAAVAASELARGALAGDFRNVDPADARIVLVEAMERILGPYPEDLAAYAARVLESKGVEIRTGAAVEDVETDHVVIGGERLVAGTVLWTAGVEATQVGRWLDVETDRSGRAKVAPDLTVPGDPAIRVVGDAALVEDEDGQPLPGLAAVAKQQGRHAADAVAAAVRGESPPGPFRYRDYGTLVPLGRGKAIAEIGGRPLRGFPAWFVWAVVHIVFLVDMRRRLMVLFNWFWAYAVSRRGSRIIVDERGTTVDEVAGIEHEDRRDSAA